MKLLFSLMLLMGTVLTTQAADTETKDSGAAARRVARPTATPLESPAAHRSLPASYEAARADLADLLERSVSPDSRPYVGAVGELELQAKYQHDVVAHEAVKAVHQALVRIKDVMSDDPALEHPVVPVTDAKRVVYDCLVAKGLAEKRTFGYNLTAEATRSLITYVNPKDTPVSATEATAKQARFTAGMARWGYTPVVIRTPRYESSRDRFDNRIGVGYTGPLT